MIFCTNFLVLCGRTSGTYFIHRISIFCLMWLVSALVSFVASANPFFVGETTCFTRLEALRRLTPSFRSSLPTAASVLFSSTVLCSHSMSTASRLLVACLRIQHAEVYWLLISFRCILSCFTAFLDKSPMWRDGQHLFVCSAH